MGGRRGDAQRDDAGPPMTTHHVQTVLGPVEVEEIGITLPHEHLLVDLVLPYFEPSGHPDVDALAPFTAAMREPALANFNVFADNLRLDDGDTIVAELEPFTAAGGSTVVELSSVDIGRNPSGLRDISRRAGVHVVMGCGYYIDRSQPPSARAASMDEIAQEMVADLRQGPGDTRVRAGIIGEIGVDALSQQERKILQAAAEAQRQTGAAINVHVEFIMGGAHAGRWSRDVLAEAGADLSRVIFSHQDSSHADRAYQEQLLADGIVIEYDGFGIEMATAAYGGLNYPTDDERVAALATLVDAGWENQLLVSTDICMKVLLSSFGGHGYGHVLDSVVPKMRRAGIGESAIQAILVDTPRRLLALPNGAIT
jgi:phosphotriesterase-related protein